MKQFESVTKERVKQSIDLLISYLHAMSSKPLRRIVVLISGSGTNLQALIDAKIPHSEFVLVVSNRKNAYGLVRAEEQPRQGTRRL